MSAGIEMSRSGSTFTASVLLPHRQQVQYLFLVDGVDWVTDPNNPDSTMDTTRNTLSVVTASCGCPEPDFDWRDAIAYRIVIDRFVNGDPMNDGAPVANVATAANYEGGDVAGVLGKIEDGTFNALGVNVLWLTSPIEVWRRDWNGRCRPAGQSAAHEVDRSFAAPRPPCVAA